MSFYGSDLGLVEYERIAQNISDKVLKIEDSLFNSKWFDYRPYHYVAATYLFAHKYDLAFKYFNKTSVGLHVSHNKGFVGKDIMAHREKLSFWKCRQIADQMGIQYSFFLRAAMRFAMANGWKRAPRPCQIYKNSEMLVFVANEWDVINRAVIRYPKSSMYNVDEWNEHPAQIAFEKYIVEQIKLRRYPKFALATALYDKRCLRVDVARKLFQESIIKDAHLYFVENSHSLVI